MTTHAAVSVGDLYENAPCGLLLTTSDDMIVGVNATFLEWTGFSESDLIGRDFHGLLSPGSQAFYGTRYQAELWARGEMREIAFRLTRGDGTIMPILVNSRLTEIPGADEHGVRLAIFDSTARDDYEREMLAAKRQAERSEATVRVLQEASSRFLEAGTEVELASALTGAVRDAFAAMDVAVVFFGNDGQVSMPAGEHLRDTLIELDSARRELSLSASKPLILPSLEDAFIRSDRMGRVLRSVRAQALTAIPLFDGSVLVGALVCLFGRSRHFDDEAIELQRALSRQALLSLSRLRLQNELRQRAMHDQLTGLANRILLHERLTHVLATATYTGRPMAVIFVDLDGFKKVNDTLGHHVGDVVLSAVASRMMAAVRETDIVGRYGGDEFVVVCESTDDAGAHALAERLGNVIREPIADLPREFSITASFGIAVFVPGESLEPTADSLVRQADSAMYVSKKAGADRTTLVRA